MWHCMSHEQGLLGSPHTAPCSPWHYTTTLLAFTRGQGYMHVRPGRWRCFPACPTKLRCAVGSVLQGAPHPAPPHPPIHQPLHERPSPEVILIRLWPDPQGGCQDGAEQGATQPRGQQPPVQPELWHGWPWLAPPSPPPVWMSGAGAWTQPARHHGAARGFWEGPAAVGPSRGEGWLVGARLEAVLVAIKDV